ncbi:FMRFamide receptor [Trichinella patagoniensis]|uniref:FMRFamide receptor n=1 Tax=Trichinella patagoniensis TaxID=990121 RepID=A0A0V1A1S7_9BILA|nr:FMRFamide receptor [Trichinella patagoniensis]
MIDEICSFSQSKLLTGNVSEIFLNVINQFHQQYQAVHGHLCIVLCLFGIVTNILNCIVLTRRQMRSASNMFLAIIALIDMGLMVLYLVYVAHFVVVQQCSHFIYTYSWTWFLLLHALFSVVLHTISLWLAALFALVRLIVIRRTQDVSLFLTTRFIGKLFCYLAISVAILSIPHALTFTVVQETVPCKEHSENTSIRYTLMPSQLAIAGDCFLLKTTFWINGFPFKLVPCVILFVSILSLVKFLSEAQAKKQRIFGNNKRQQPVRYISRSTTKLLVTILSIFLITEIPQAIVATLSGIFPAEIYAKIYPKVGDLLDLLALINCNANFILLCIMSSQFRTTFASMFLPRRFQCQTTLMLDSTSRTTRIDT